MSRLKIKNVEIAKEVCKAIPDLEFEKVLSSIDAGRNPRQEQFYVKDDIIQNYIDGFKAEIEG